MLIILDNFEHLVKGSLILFEIIQRTEYIKFLLSSRITFKLQTEFIFKMKGMRIPESIEEVKKDSFSSIELFKETAKRVLPDFILKEKELPYVIEIRKKVCHLGDLAFPCRSKKRNKKI